MDSHGPRQRQIPVEGAKMLRTKRLTERHARGLGHAPGRLQAALERAARRTRRRRSERGVGMRRASGCGCRQQLNICDIVVQVNFMVKLLFR